MGKKQDSIINNFFWKFAESAAPQLVSLVVSIILARLLEPAFYGTISIVTIFVTIANVFVNDGFAEQLV